MQSYDTFLNTIIRYLENPDDDTLTQEVSTWRKQNEENELYYQQIYKIWIFSENSKSLNQLNSQQSTQRFTNKLKSHVISSPKSSQGWWLRGMAASIIIVLGLSVYSYYNNRLVYITKTTQNLADSILLSDGSKVYLKAKTSVRYPEKFKSEKREIFLTKGTAFFKISRDTLKPFTIVMDNSSVRVLGTSFTIAKTDLNIKLGVKTGKVLFSPSVSADPLILNAGNGINFNLINKIATPYNAVNENDDAWLTKELVFIDAPLQEVVTMLENHFNKKITFKGDIKNLGKFNAKFKNASLPEIFEVIEQTYPIKYSKKDTSYSLKIIN